MIAKGTPDRKALLIAAAALAVLAAALVLLLTFARQATPMMKLAPAVPICVSCDDCRAEPAKKRDCRTTADRVQIARAGWSTES